MMQRVFNNVVEAGMNHPVVTGAIGVVSSMTGKIFVAATSAEVTFDTYDDWTVRIATTVGILVSLLTIYILIIKIWRESTVIRPRTEKVIRMLRIFWHRKSLYTYQIKRFFDK